MASVTKLPSGKFRALVRKVGHEPMSETFKSRSDAKKWGQAQDDRIDAMDASGKAPPPKGSTFPDFIEKYIEETSSVKPHGKNKAACLKTLKAAFKGVPMTSMTESRIGEFVTQRSKDKNRLGEIISGVTIAIDLAYIGTVMKWAKTVKHYDVDQFAAKAVRGTLETRGFSVNSREREREATAEELEKIRAEYLSKGQKLKIPMPEIILFAIHSAMRLEEIFRIKIEDLSLTDGTVWIRDRKDPKEKKGNDQLVPVFDQALKIIKREIGDRKEGRIFAYNHRSVSSSFTRVCAKCKIKDLHFHDLRHTAIGLLFELGLSIPEVAVVSGHKDWKMLKRYTHVKAKDVSERHREQLARRKRRNAVMDYLTDSESDSADD